MRERKDVVETKSKKVSSVAKRIAMNASIIVFVMLLEVVILWVPLLQFELPPFMLEMIWGLVILLIIMTIVIGVSLSLFDLSSYRKKLKREEEFARSNNSIFP